MTRPRLNRHPFWSEWAWNQIAAGAITLGEAVELLRLQLLYRRAGIL